MAEFVHNDVILVRLRKEEDLVVEIQASAAGAASPSTLVVSDGDFIDGNAVYIVIEGYSLAHQCPNSLSILEILSARGFVQYLRIRTFENA